MKPNNCCNVDDFIKAIADETGQSEPLILREPHPGKQIAYIVRVQFPYHREPMCRLKVEMTVDEPILISPESRTILHNDEEAISTHIKVYHLAEIVAEKYRALLQSLDRLQKKGWGANRVCRDYYDLWSILKKWTYQTTIFLLCWIRKA